MTGFKRELCCPAIVDDLPLVIDFVGAACEEAEVAPGARFELQLAAEEACANVVEHAYAGQGGEFSIEFAVQGPDVLITLRDHGEPFDPTSVPAPDTSIPLEHRPIGGLGLYLMQQLMDDLHFSFSSAGNVLVMTKRNVVAPAAP